MTFSLSPILGKDGLEGLFCAYSETTEIMAEKLAKLDHARIEAEKNNHAKDLFLATISHELGFSFG